ncbi:DNA-3-methyladenine glycosylase I [Aerococcaceae bacterium 50-4]
MVTRCQFANTPEMMAYHDNEWGQIKTTSQEVFEALCLESLQAGLSWAIVLKKRPNLRRAFAQFDFHVLSAFDDLDVDRLMLDESIIRHRQKIQAMVNNAQCALAIEADPELPDFKHYIYETAQQLLESYDGNEDEMNKAFMKILKKRGFKFVGPTTIESFLETIGVYNHHDQQCFLH